jgi:hypothetical protein
MRIVLYVLCLLGVARGEADPVSAQSGVVRAALGAELKQRFKYDPPPKTDTPEDDITLLVLPRFEVFDSRLDLGLKADRVVERERMLEAAEKFSWRHGGTIAQRGRLKVMFKYDPENNAINLLKLAW